MAFIQRTTPPTAADLYWTRRANGGYNYCVPGNTKLNGPLAWAGCVLPNCTGYASGRFMECQGITTNELLRGGDMNAGAYYSNSSAYEHGQVPKLGAIACWSGGTEDMGHVAVVEEIYSNTDITISESHWKGTYAKGTWWRRWRGNPNAYWTALHFQGYIYPDEELIDQPSTIPEWIYHSAYSYPNWSPGGPEQQNNAARFYYLMSAAGFSTEAIAAMLGNIQSESLINPQQKEVLDYPWTTQNGYGLTQWTHATKLIDWAQQEGLDYTDGDTQVKRIIYEFENGVQYGYNGNWGFPPINGQQFKTSNLPPETLAEYFLKWYENPLSVSSTIDARKSQARYWYNYINNLPEGSDFPHYEHPSSDPRVPLNNVQLFSCIASKLTKRGGKQCKEIISI